jgi:NAD(P)-dependent dehydrogenase (short-subunit alcohol dehydrogenase family)
MVDFAGSHVVVTGGTGALGRAVIGALRAARAICHVPNLVAAELDDFPYASDPDVRITRGIDLADVLRFAPSIGRCRHCGHRFIWPADLRWRRSAKRRPRTLSPSSG